jgi:ParB-like chromosome segregation protein Spo0J
VKPVSKNTFNLGDYLKSPAMSEQDTRGQLEYIDLDRIDPDPENFYSLDGLDELAANIELVGLQQPLRVRPALSGGSAEALSGAARQLPQRGSRDRYIVVSGHRRRAACLMIRDGGNRMFEGGVPCIVERGDVSKEMRELRLIYANAATRVMTSAELSKQAARVEELLYELKKQGVEFPGRMRDHVAAAVNASKTKLGRLHAIRGRLVPPLLKMFDAGEINESVAYRISQEEAAIQEDLAKAPAILRGETAEKIGQIIDKLKAPPEPVGAAISRPQKDDDGRSRTPAPTEDDEAADENDEAPTEDDEAADENDEAPAENGGRQIAAPTEIIPTWMSGTPPRDGRYFVRIDMGDGGIHEAVGSYRFESWTVFNGPLYSGMQVVGWWPLPDKEGA